MADSKKIKAALEKGTELPTINTEKKNLLSTGSSVLNLALTDQITGGFVKGTYVLFVGDTDSGKTFFCMTCLAEASINKEFDDYRFLFINKERGVLMPIGKFFGPGVEKRLEMLYCETVEDMYDTLHAAFEENKPFICVVDSIDALSSVYEEKKALEGRTARKGNKKPKGDFGDGKAKVHSRFIRQILSGLERTGSIIIFINQSRDNVDGGMFDSPDTHSGGRAISFYAAMKIWAKRGPDLTKSYRSKDRQVGMNARIRVVRTRVTGRTHKITVPIYHSVGIDDIGSCVDYLIDEGVWKKPQGSTIIQAMDFDVELNREKLVAHIEENDLEFDTRDLVNESWQQVKRACQIERKPRYH